MQGSLRRRGSKADLWIATFLSVTRDDGLFVIANGVKQSRKSVFSLFAVSLCLSKGATNFLTFAKIL